MLTSRNEREAAEKKLNHRHTPTPRQGATRPEPVIRHLVESGGKGHDLRDERPRGEQPNADERPRDAQASRGGNAERGASRQLVEEHLPSSLLVSTATPRKPKDAGSAANRAFSQARRPDWLQRGEKVGPYEIQDRVGMGGFGALYRATRDGRDYALKIPLSRPDTLEPQERDAAEERLGLEVGTLLMVRHPNVVRVREFFRWPNAEEGFVVIVMDFVRGQPFYRWVRESTPSLRTLLTAIAKLGRALDGLHRHNIHHRDIKSSNVLVTAEGSPVLVDFGIARPRSAFTVTGEAMVLGTYTHWAPEYVEFMQSPAFACERFPWAATTDLYALGNMAYGALCGREPHWYADRDAASGVLPAPFIDALLQDHLEAPSKHNPALPPGVDEVLLKLLAKRPEDRFQSGARLAAELEALLSRADVRVKLDALVEVPPGPGPDEKPATRAEPMSGPARCTTGEGVETRTRGPAGGSPRDARPRDEHAKHVLNRAEGPRATSQQAREGHAGHVLKGVEGRGARSQQPRGEHAQRRARSQVNQPPPPPPASLSIGRAVAALGQVVAPARAVNDAAPPALDHTEKLPALVPAAPAAPPAEGGADAAGRTPVRRVKPPTAFNAPSVEAAAAFLSPEVIAPVARAQPQRQSKEGRPSVALDGLVGQVQTRLGAAGRPRRQSWMPFAFGAVALVCFVAFVVAVNEPREVKAGPQSLLSQVEKDAALRFADSRPTDGFEPRAPPEPPAPPESAPSPTRGQAAPPSSKRTRGADAQQVDALLAKEYGDRPLPGAKAPGKRADLPRWMKSARKQVAVPESDTAAADPRAKPLQVPMGAELPIRLQKPLDSRTVSSGPVVGRLLRAFVLRGKTLLPGGTMVYGTATASGAGRFDIRFTRLRLPDNSEVPFDGLAMDANDKKPGLAPSRRISLSRNEPGLVSRLVKGTAAAVLGKVSGGDAVDIARGAGETVLGHEEGASAPPSEALLLDAPIDFTVFVSASF